jgi:regulator of sigma E protease
MLPTLILFLALVGQAGTPIVVQQVTPGAPAEAQGLRPGDRILAVDGRPLTDPYQLSVLISGSNGHAFRFDVESPAGVRRSLVVQPDYLQLPGEDAPRWLIGVRPGGSFDLGAGLRQSVEQYFGLIGGMFAGFHELVSGHIAGGLTGPCGPSGPVGIVRATGAAASEGLLPLLFFAAFLSLNLGILNLLPIPALDGGRLLFLVWEAVVRRPLDPQKEQRVHYIGLVVLIGLILLISFNDVLRLPTPFQTLVNQCQ